MFTNVVSSYDRLHKRLQQFISKRRAINRLAKLSPRLLWHRMSKLPCDFASVVSRSIWIEQQRSLFSRIGIDHVIAFTLIDPLRRLLCIVASGNEVSAL